MTHQELWHDTMTIEWWRMLLIGLFLVLMNFVIFVAMWYVRRAHAIEYGYPKLKKKKLKQKLQQYSILENLLLVKLTLDAEKKGFFLYLNLACHLGNLVGFCSCIIGFIGSMITLADGWALTLLVGSVLFMLFVTGLIEFIPHLIWLPSERKRYMV